MTSSLLIVGLADAHYRFSINRITLRGTDMETPLTPLEFARRARKLYGGRDAVVDKDSTYTYTQFFERCDRWSAALQEFGVQRGDRVAYIAPNTRAQLESFYAVPQIGAVLVPINFRLTADDFAYLINHSGARVVCADADYMDAIDRIRSTISPEHIIGAVGALKTAIEAAIALILEEHQDWHLLVRPHHLPLA